MTPNNPFEPPQARLADSTGDTVDIESLPVSDVWKKRFRWMQKAGGPGLPRIKQLPAEEQGGLSMFNILAFLFGPIYYLVKGMWRRGLVLFGICLVAILILEALLAALGLEALSRVLGFGASAVYALRANADYYKKMVLDDNGWW